MKSPFAASLSCGSKGPIGALVSGLGGCPPLLISCGWDVGAAGWGACCAWACSRLAAAALRAVRWKSMVPGVAAVGPASWAKRACELGLGAGNMDPLPPGVRPVLNEDSFGVGKPPRMWCVSLK